MWNLRVGWEYFLFQATAKKPESAHSPYLFDLFSFIHDPDRQYYDFEQIEHVRSELLLMETPVPTQDFGAGSRVKTSQRVMDIARIALSPAQRCRVIYRLLIYHKPVRVLEMGTSLGIMSAYLAAATEHGEVDTVEGNAALSEIASGISAQLCLQNIHFHRGPFADVLPSLLSEIKFDIVLIDGDHRGTALKQYMTMLSPHLAENAIVIIDDIRWSKDMFQAWKQLSSDPSVTCAIDYFFFGLLFFRKDFLDKVEMRVRLKG